MILYLSTAFTSIIGLPFRPCRNAGRQSVSPIGDIIPSAIAETSQFGKN